MMLLRKILFPLAILYWIVTWFRNWLYDAGIFKSASWPVPVIAVGNLSVGGTGKTPQVEHLLRLLADTYRTAVLSRGYKRATKGFVRADEGADAASIGDEPFQYFSNFRNVAVAVDADRNHGIKQLLNAEHPPQVIVLDDAYQHRKVNAGLYILLTMYGDLYIDDYILPFGNLREPAAGADRAHIIIVTKCPLSMTESERKAIRARFNLNISQLLFFSYIQYGEFAISENSSIEKTSLGNKLIVAGIARPEVFYGHVRNEGDDVLTFPDHYAFTDSDIQEILARAAGRVILTTQKDYVRLNGKIPVDQLFYLPITTQFFDDGDDFNRAVLEYVSAEVLNGITN
jgi:tetraacyldisaccharide 4'-kinase